MQALRTLLLVSCGLCTCATHAAIDSGNWFRYNSKHFEVYSKLKEKQVAGRIRDLEAFRSVIHLLTGTTDKGHFNHSTKLMLLSTQAEIASVYKVEGAAGFLRPGLRNNLVVVGRHNKRNLFSSENDVVFHEYVHYLMRNVTSFNYPTWYDEGFAELFSSTDFKDGKARVGIIPKKLAYSLVEEKRMPLADLLPVTSTWSLKKRRRLSFYARSWVLVHYLHFSEQSRAQQLGAKITRYLQLYNRGEDPERAFLTAFGVTPDVFDEALKAYEKASLPSYGIPLEKLSFDGSYSRTALSREEISYELADQIAQRNPLYARKLFQRILKKAADDPRASAGMGITFQMQQDFDQARVWLEKAVELAPKDYLVHIELADLIAATCRPGDWTDCGWENSRQVYARHMEKAYRLAPDLLETKVGYAKALNVLEDTEATLPLMESALELAPWNLQVIVMLGVAQLNNGQFDRGEKTLNRALGWSGESPGLEAQIRSALMQLELLKRTDSET